MRMWLCNPRILCQKHLCGEHVEMHMFVGTLKKQKKVDGYIKNNLFQPRAIFIRHQQLSFEMLTRGMNHKSDMQYSDIDISYLSQEYQDWEIDKELALNDLLNRCPDCKKRYDLMQEMSNVINDL